MQTNFCTNHRYYLHAIGAWAGHSIDMLIEVYIEALLVDDELTDFVWEALEQGRIEVDTARAAWLAVAITTSVPDTGHKVA